MPREILIVVALAALLAAPASAAPLSNDASKSVTARWVPAQSVRCDAVCDAQGAQAENMLVYTSDGADIYLCRVRKPPSNRFGTNYEDVCKVEDSAAPAGTALESRYECLCIWPAKEK